MKNKKAETESSMAEQELSPKQKRRHARQVNAARAEGLMQGMVGLMRPSDVAIDCGANVGTVTQSFARSGALIHAFEPDPVAFEALEINTRGFPNVVRHQAAVGVAANKLDLMRSIDFDAGPLRQTVKSTLVAGNHKVDYDKQNAVSVDVIDFPKHLIGLLDQYEDVAVLKLDIEGAELELLNLLLDRNLLDRIRFTVAETHEKQFRLLARDYAELRRRVAERYDNTKVFLDWI
uniref:FkbM family methyltransferase n=1 Tax=Ruegeria arenilitoris TaxID=1173585 RepID=UPI00147CE8BF|nr:FkbM family methyltransferase [Ruegeria arenilitoris]